jgi:hypothetical protein
MDDIHSKAQNPEDRRGYEWVLYLAAKEGDAKMVAQWLRCQWLGWKIDPNCGFSKGRTPLIANARGTWPNATLVRSLLAHGADPSLTDEFGLTALDYARRKLAQLQTRPPLCKFPWLD